MICELCSKNRRKCDSIKLQTREIFVCRDCQSYIIMNGLGFEGDIMIVPVKPSSLEKALKEKKYVRPWRKGAKHAAFLAFYHEGAITHVGRVKAIGVKVGKDVLVDFLPRGEEWGKKEFYTVYDLAYIEALKRPVLREGNCLVQSKLLVPFKRFSKAKTVCDLV